MIKKFVAILMCSLCILAVFVGCGNNKNAEIVGEWLPTTATINGETIKYSELGIEENHFSLTFTQDGKCTAILAGITSESDFTFNGTSVDIELNGTQHKLEYNAGTLKWTLNYGEDNTSFTFAKATKENGAD